MKLIKKENIIRESEMHRNYEDELDDLLDDDFLKATPREENKQARQPMETLGDELNELCGNYGEGLFEFDDETSFNHTLRGYTTFKSIIKNASSKKIGEEDLGVYEDISPKDKTHSDLPFTVAKDMMSSSEGSTKKFEDIMDSHAINLANKAAKFKDQKNHESTHTLLTVNLDPKTIMTSKKVSSAGNSPNKPKNTRGRRRIPHRSRHKGKPRNSSLKLRYPYEEVNDLGSAKGANSLERIK